MSAAAGAIGASVGLTLGLGLAVLFKRATETARPPEPTGHQVHPAELVRAEPPAQTQQARPAGTADAPAAELEDEQLSPVVRFLRGALGAPTPPLVLVRSPAPAAPTTPTTPTRLTAAPDDTPPILRAAAPEF